jgi:DNA-binding SARP family transcriptional activator
MARLAMSLLGTFEVTLDGVPVTAFGYDKVRALLAYLAVEADRPHRRYTLTSLLWPEQPERQARQNLSQALLRLRQALGDRGARPPYLLISPQSLQFNRSSDYELDVTAFISLLDACRAHDHGQLAGCASCLKRRGRAVALYRGGLLAGFALGDSPAFEEWALLQRERLQYLAVDALHHLVLAYQAGGTTKRRCPMPGAGWSWTRGEKTPAGT